MSKSGKSPFEKPIEFARSPIRFTRQSVKFIKPEEPPRIPEIQEEVRKENEQNKMSLKDIQHSMAFTIPEFSGENTPHLANELKRFLGTADMAYSRITDTEEKKLFDEMIIYRLKGNAYASVCNKQIEDYPALKSCLQDLFIKTTSLEELHKNFIEIQQKFNETARQYGHRLTEAKEQYTNAYRIKYKLAVIDPTYNKHLEEMAVTAYKKGLNNTILQSKINTFKASTIRDIVDETELIEKMLIMTSTTTAALSQPVIAAPETQPRMHTPQQFTQQNRPIQIVCHYCQRPNHTYKLCRTRMADEDRERRQARYQPPTNYGRRPPYQSQQLIQPNQNTTYNHFQPNFNNTRPNNKPNYTENRFTQPRLNPPPQQPENRYNYNPKYCSHCKTTKGHTYEECRSKFFPRNDNQQTIHKPPDNQSLEEQLSKMRISTIAPHYLETIPHPGNSRGSSSN